jgi:hypothetical protein
MDDDAVVEWLVKKHKVCLIPGSSCGQSGYMRAAFANLKPEVGGLRLSAGEQTARGSVDRGLERSTYIKKMGMLSGVP